MLEMLKMRTVDFKKLDEEMERVRHFCPDWDGEKEGLVDLLPENWESQPVIWFNEGFKYGELDLFWMTEMLQYFKIPYEFFYDGEIEADDYWEFYNPSVSPIPQTANYSKEFSGFLFKEWNLKELEHLPGDLFKEAVIQFFNNPFTNYPALDKIMDEEM